MVKLSDKDEINSNCIKYLNRLSDLMFVLGRLINKRKNIEDTIWNPQKDTHESHSVKHFRAYFQELFLIFKTLLVVHLVIVDLVYGCGDCSI